MWKRYLLCAVILTGALNAQARDFTSNDTSQPFCQDALSILKEFGISVSASSMTTCSLRVLGGVYLEFDRPTGRSLEVEIKSDPYRMFVTENNASIGRCLRLNPRSIERNVRERDC
ncbi:MAG: hypothetical protein EBS77_01495 [Gammaproteobacteria bacterium]|nr:hypothetical protein [Gammaproteobacteria bacterium]